MGEAKLLRILLSFCFLLGIICNAEDVKSQDFKREMERMNEFYSTVENYKSTIKIDVYSAGSQGKLLTRTSSVNKQGQNFYYSMGETELLMTGDVLIMVDKSNKQILYRKLTKDQRNALHKKYITGEMDSTLMTYDSLKYNGEVGKLKHYSIYQSKKLIDRSELYLDRESGRIDKISYFYNQKLAGQQVYKADILFENVQLNPVFSENTFSEEKFIKKVGKGIVPSGAYSTYRLEIIDID